MVKAERRKTLLDLFLRTRLGPDDKPEAARELNSCGAMNHGCPNAWSVTGCDKPGEKTAANPTKIELHFSNDCRAFLFQSFNLEAERVIFFDFARQKTTRQLCLGRDSLGSQ